MILTSNLSFYQFEILKNSSQFTILKGKSTNNSFFILKISNSNDLNQKNYKSLKKEATIMEILKDVKNIPKLKYFGECKEISKHLIVEELVGSDLLDLRNIYEKFSLKTSLKIFFKLIKNLELIHNHGIIHRDLKPENIAISLDKKEIIIIDFGLAKNLCEKNMKGDIKKLNIKKKKFTGNLRYCGLFAHAFNVYLKLNDLMAVGFIFIDFFIGTLPWIISNKLSFKERNKVIMEKKLCFIQKEAKKISIYLDNYFKYLLNIKNEKNINYSYLLEEIKKIGLDYNINIYDEDWDWDDFIKEDSKLKEDFNLLTKSQTFGFNFFF